MGDWLFSVVVELCMWLVHCLQPTPLICTPSPVHLLLQLHLCSCRIAVPDHLSPFFSVLKGFLSYIQLPHVPLNALVPPPPVPTLLSVILPVPSISLSFSVKLWKLPPVSPYSWRWGNNGRNLWELQLWATARLRLNHGGKITAWEWLRIPILLALLSRFSIIINVCFLS